MVLKGENYSWQLTRASHKFISCCCFSLWELLSLWHNSCRYSVLHHNYLLRALFEDCLSPLLKFLRDASCIITACSAYSHPLGIHCTPWVFVPHDESSSPLHLRVQPQKDDSWSRPGEKIGIFSISFCLAFSPVPPGKIFRGCIQKHWLDRKKNQHYGKASFHKSRVKRLALPE